MATDFMLPDLNEEPIPDLNEVPATAPGPAKRKILTNLEKDQISQMLILNYNNDKFEKGTINQIASKYEVTRLVISKIWKVSLQAIKNGDHPDVKRIYKGGNKSKVFDLQKENLNIKKRKVLGKLEDIKVEILEYLQQHGIKETGNRNDKKWSNIQSTEILGKF
ncbi:hypothetical protein AgCh_007353 [Apium graveolens]